MSQVHICNTFFEKELETNLKKPLKEWMRSHKVVSQLQFLPLLYARADDRILVSDLPDDPDPRLCPVDEPPKDLVIEHWGPSLAIEAFSKRHNISYDLPNWELVREINSKVFSFTESPKLPGAKLLHTRDEIEDWLQSTPGPKVLKSPFGTAGSGHIKNPDRSRAFTTPMIAEPWVERILDFSTQWYDGKLLGVTIFENDPNGVYQGTFVGDVEDWALREHLLVAEPLIKKIFQMGYSGHIGVDAFIYLWGKERRVHPIVEINARKTMSWIALQLPEKRLKYTRSETGILPSRLRGITFPKNVNYRESASNRQEAQAII